RAAHRPGAGARHRRADRRRRWGGGPAGRPPAGRAQRADAAGAGGPRHRAARPGRGARAVGGGLVNVELGEGPHHDLVERVVERARGARLVVVGDLMLDEYVRGTVERMSPEAPVPVVRASERSASVGGAANVAAHLAAYGAEVALVGVVGDDAAGSELRE